MKKLFNYKSELFRLDKDVIEQIKNDNNVYLTQDQGTKIWSVTDKRTPFNAPYTWKVYLPNPSKKHPEQPNYEDLAYSLGYLYDVDEVMEILELRGESLEAVKF